MVLDKLVVQIGRVLEKRLSVTVSEAMHRDIKVCAALHGESMNTIIVNAVKAYLAKCCKNGDEMNTD